MENLNRREFLKTVSAVGAMMAAGPLVSCAPKTVPETQNQGLVPLNRGLKITGTFLDEITYDVPYQNWGEKEWDRDFACMKAIGIDTVILMRAGYRRFLTYPSRFLMRRHGCYFPSVDRLDMFLRLSDKYRMRLYAGLYDSGNYWDAGRLLWEIEDQKLVIDEVWKQYGHYKSFGGWYIGGEICRKTRDAIEAFRAIGQHCKAISGGLPVFISLRMDGKTTERTSSGQLAEILDGVQGAVDICAFQDGALNYDEPDAFYEVNKKLAHRYGLQCWTHTESFDRTTPAPFRPLSFDKLRLKLEAAARTGCDKAITFEFSHFMSPQSNFQQAGDLYNRYKEYIQN
jgi:hypothetical protein